MDLKDHKHLEFFLRSSGRGWNATQMFHTHQARFKETQSFPVCVLILLLPIIMDVVIDVAIDLREFKYLWRRGVGHSSHNSGGMEEVFAYSYVPGISIRIWEKQVFLVYFSSMGSIETKNSQILFSPIEVARILLYCNISYPQSKELLRLCHGPISWVSPFVLY
jgi:hypothetical protein